MAKNTKIEWCDHTFNPWIGCTKVSPGCANCYAETLMDKRLGKVAWGKGQPRQRTSEANWKKVYGWDAARTFRRKPTRQRVFVASLADWLDPEVPAKWLADLLALVLYCKHLDFLMLTKRPELWRERIEAAYNTLVDAFDQFTTDAERERVEASDEWKIRTKLVEWRYGQSIPDNVWIGTSVENQAMADKRIPELLKIPAKVRFLSCEPLLGPVHIEPCLLSSADKMAYNSQYLGNPSHLDKVHWVICGGESGPNARPMHPEWVRSLRDQCEEWGTPFLFKQWGEWMPHRDCEGIVPAAVNHHWGLCQPAMARVGKKLAGRLLDGVEHNEFPEENYE